MSNRTRGSRLYSAPTCILCRQAPESAIGQPCGSLSAGNIRRTFGGTFETPCAEWLPTTVTRELHLDGGMQSVGREYTSTIRRNIRNTVR
eukprot:1185307-Prorocentrum_minimum.AAC.3